MERGTPGTQRLGAAGREMSCQRVEMQSGAQARAVAARVDLYVICREVLMKA